jgi:hypothetical protein
MFSHCLEIRMSSATCFFTGHHALFTYDLQDGYELCICGKCGSIYKRKKGTS